MKKGESWEQLVEGELRRNGLRMVQKTEPCPRIVKNLGKGRFEVIFTGSGVLDFAGCWQGRYVELDAKDIGGDRFRFSRDMKKAQIQRIKDLREEGGKVGLVIRFRTGKNPRSAVGDRLFCVPGKVVQDAVERDVKSITVADCEKSPHCLEVSYGRWSHLADWVLKLN
jgi:penicillin-binding protein-related factor A (putative recombinase)